MNMVVAANNASPGTLGSNGFPGSAAYWEKRYAAGGNSGAGSYGRLAKFKAAVVNQVVRDSNVRFVIDLGCGDGSQLELLEIPEYMGFDVSPTSLQMCRERYRSDLSRRFALIDEIPGKQADMTMSLDVVYHLVEDNVFEQYMHQLFDASRNLVLIYASDPVEDCSTSDAHVRHRAVSRWVAKFRPDYELLGKIENPYPLKSDPGTESFAHFSIFQRRAPNAETPRAPDRHERLITDELGESQKTSSVVASLSGEWLQAMPPIHQVVAGMATVAGNEAALFQALNSLLPQVDRLYLYLNAFSSIPPLLADNPKLRCILDTEGIRYGDAGKFWGLEQCEDAVFISCDDDILYPPDYVARMVAALAEHRGACIATVHGSLMRQRVDGTVRPYYAPQNRSVIHFEQPLAVERRVHFPGTGTVAFHTQYVKPGLAYFARPNMADIWLAKYSIEHALPVMAVRREANWLKQLQVNRPSIYEDSIRGRKTFCDTAEAQGTLVAGLLPISTLQTAPHSLVAYVVRVESIVDLELLLDAIYRADPNSVVFLVDALPRTGPALSMEHLGACQLEIHIIPQQATEDLRRAYRALLIIGASELRCLALIPDGASSTAVSLGAEALQSLIPLP
ncbi:methyltransferase domain-containing protein [Ideonella dechloratans]|uniref:methyltransferase domain-containing protein n=1 Tax=Ideonella dechloratans TaxID=36863 RepID=UPI0035ADCE98